MKSFYGFKLDNTQAFNKKGKRIVVTNIKVNPIIVMQVKNEKTDGYKAIQFGIGKKSMKSIKQPQKKVLNKLKIKTAPKHIKEVRVKEIKNYKSGDQIKVTDILSVEDKVKVTGTSKGRGFAGVMKRWGFHGGPRTHGQSDRQRSPGSIGQGTDPGRVWKGKKMPGRFGTDTKTIKNLTIFNIDEEKNIIQIQGTVPGHRNSLIQIIKQ